MTLNEMYKLDPVGRLLYRSIFRSAQNFDRNPVLKVLISKQGKGVPAGLHDIICSFLGEAEYFIPSPLFKRSLKELVQLSFRHPPFRPDVDVAFAGLRYLEGITAIANKHGLTDIDTAHQDKQTHASGKYLSASRGGIANQHRSLHTVSISTSTSRASEGRYELLGIAEPGTVLVAHPLLSGWFSRSTILVCRHGLTSGSYGLCLNKPLPTDLRTFALKEMAASMSPPSFRDMVQSIVNPGSQSLFGGEDVAAPIGLVGMGLLPQVHEGPSEGQSSERVAVWMTGADDRDLMVDVEVENGEMSKDTEADLEPTAAEDWRQLLPSSQANEEVEEGGHWAEGPSTSPIHPAEDDWVQVEVTGPGRGSPQHQQQRNDNGEQGEAAQQGGEDLISDPETVDIFGSCRMHRGGPVPGMQMLHSCLKLGGVELLPHTASSPPLFLGGEMRHARELVMSKELLPSEMCFFSGECIWHPQQLEHELASGMWISLRLPPHLLYEHLPERKGRKKEYKQVGRRRKGWSSVLQATGGDLAALARIPHKLAEDIQELDIS